MAKHYNHPTPPSIWTSEVFTEAPPQPAVKAPSTFLRSLITTVGLLVAYVLATLLVRVVALPEVMFTVSWWPTGIAVAGLFIFGTSHWPAVSLGALMVLTTGSWRHYPTMIAMGTLGDTLEAVFAATMLRHLIGFCNPFRRANRLAIFLFISAFVAPIISATIGTVAVHFSGIKVVSPSGYAWFVWWLENSMGVLVAGSLLAAWYFDPPWRWSRKKQIELVLSLAGICLSAAILFNGLFPAIVKNYPIEILCTPLLVTMAFRLGSTGAATGAFLLSFLCVLGTAHGFGPFVRSYPQESSHILQTYIATNALLALFLSAIVAERERIQRRLYYSNVELERFAYLASHDLQEPLRTIRAFCTVLQRDLRPEKSDRTREHLSLVIKASGRMYELIDSLREYSSVGKNLKFEPVDINRVIMDCLDVLHPEIENKCAKIAFDSMPTVIADNKAITTVFQNLLSNAIKFSGDSPPYVHLSATRTGRYWRFLVEDNGIGIEKVCQPKVFKLFQRFVTDTEKYPGTGLGLAICKKILQEHGGKIWREDPVSAKGSRFFFTLPISRHEI